MKAVALTGVRKLGVIEVPAPTIRSEHDVLLKIERVGICGSDMHYFETGRIGARAAVFPFVLGHECSGTALETGPAVRRVKVGDQVAVDPAISCFECDQCRAGRPHTCRKLRFLGCPGELDGCLGEYLVMPESSLYPTHGKLNLDQALLCEPMSIGWYAVRLGHVRPGQDIAILGAGPIGLCVYLCARHAGAGTVFMTDRVPNRVEGARRAGANWAGNPDQEVVVQAVLERQRQGLEVVFECAGQQEALDQAMRMLKPGGKLVLVGIPREDRVSFEIDLMRRKEITVINVRRQNDCVQPAMDALAAGQIQADFLLTHRYRPEQAQEAFELVGGYRDGVLKAVVDF